MLCDSCKRLFASTLTLPNRVAPDEVYDPDLPPLSLGAIKRGHEQGCIFCVCLARCTIWHSEPASLKWLLHGTPDSKPWHILELSNSGHPSYIGCPTQADLLHIKFFVRPIPDGQGWFPNLCLCRRRCLPLRAERKIV